MMETLRKTKLVVVFTDLAEAVPHRTECNNEISPKTKTWPKLLVFPTQKVPQRLSQGFLLPVLQTVGEGPPP